MGVAAVRRRKPRVPALSLVHAPPATEASALAVLGCGACVHEVARSPDLSVSAGGVPRSLAPLAAASLARSLCPSVHPTRAQTTHMHTHSHSNKAINSTSAHTRTHGRTQTARRYARTASRDGLGTAGSAVMAWLLHMVPAALGQLRHPYTVGVPRRGAVPCSRAMDPRVRIPTTRSSHSALVPLRPVPLRLSPGGACCIEPSGYGRTCTFQYGAIRGVCRML